MQVTCALLVCPHTKRSGYTQPLQRCPESIPVETLLLTSRPVKPFIGATDDEAEEGTDTVFIAA